MKYIITILLLVTVMAFRVTNSGNSIKLTYRDTVPSVVPQLFGGKYYKFNGYVLTDSFIMNAPGDTNNIPYYPSLKFKASDNRWYGWDRSRWNRFLFSLDTLTLLATQYDLTLVNNGLTRNVDTTQLGGSLVKNTIINTGSSFHLQATGSLALGSATAVLMAENTGTGNGIYSTATTGSGVKGASTSGNAIFGIATSGVGGQFNSTSGFAAIQGYNSGGMGANLTTEPSSINTTATILNLNRGTTGTAANNIAGSIDFRVTTNTTPYQLTNQIVTKLTNATNGSYASQMEFWGANNATVTRKAALGATGQWTWDGYPALTAQIDTTTYKPVAIDGSGNIVKMTGWAGSGGGGLGTVTQVNTGYGVTGGSITTTGTIVVDTTTLKAVYLPLNLNMNKTINQVGNNITFTGSGKVIADSLSLKKTITPFNLYSDSADGFGHSIMFGSSATSSDSNFLSIVGHSHSLFVSNKGVSSSKIWDAVKIQMGWINAGHRAYTLYMAAINDVRTTNILNPANRPTINAIVNGLKAMWMNHMAKASFGASDVSITRSGSWNVNWNASLEAGKKTNAAYTSSGGAYIEYTFSDSSVGVQFMGNLSGGATVATIAIDGSTVETFNLNKQNDGVGGSYMPTAKFFTGLTNTTHTIRITNTSGDGLMIIDYFTNLRDAATAPPVCFFNEPHLDSTGYSGGQASNPAIDTINVKYDSLRNALPEPWRARTIVAHTNSRYIANTSSGLSSDHVHPNNTGHRQISVTEHDAINLVIADSGTIQYATDGNYYGDGKKIAFQNSVTLQDAINNGPSLSNPVAINGSIFDFNGFSRLGLGFLKVDGINQQAFAHGTLGVQGPLGGIFIGDRNGSDSANGYVMYTSSAFLSFWNTWNHADLVKIDTSARTWFRNDLTNNVFSTPSATVHIGGNDLGRAGHAPLKIGKSTWLGTPEPYAWENDSLYIGWTNGGGVRDTLATRRWTRANFTTSGYLIYTALLNQSSTSAPVASVLGSNTIGAITWARTSAGVYTGTLSGAFTSAKTFLIYPPISNGVDNQLVNIVRTNANTLTITTYTGDTSTGIIPTDGLLTDYSVEIRVYP